MIFHRSRYAAFLQISSSSVSILYTRQHRKKVRLILRCDLCKNFSQILGQNRGGVANTQVRLVVWKIRYAVLIQVDLHLTFECVKEMQWQSASSSWLLNVGEMHSPKGCESLQGSKNQVKKLVVLTPVFNKTGKKRVIVLWKPVIYR